MTSEPILLYVQIPFCPARCAFCRCVSAIPNSVLLDRGLHDPYAQALVTSIRHHVPRLAERYSPIGINWGGGTPTTLSPGNLQAIAAAFGPQWDLSAQYFCVEATADSITPSALSAMRDIGVNRLSIGVESFNDDTLKAMGRRHSAAAGLAVFDLARHYGFDRLSIDLIIGYPGESVAQTLYSIQTAISLDLSHIAAHVYSPVTNSSLVRRLRRAAVRAWDDADYAAGLPEFEGALASAGYRNHEYFHWTRPPHDADFLSLDYYFGYTGDTFGFGSDAYSFVAPHGCLTTHSMPQFLADPIAMKPGPVTLELALEKALGCAGGLDYAAIARMFGVSPDDVADNAVTHALATLPGARVDDKGIQISREQYIRQYVLGVRQRMSRLAPLGLRPASTEGTAIY